MPNPLSKIVNWYLSPMQEPQDGGVQTVLGVLPSRPESTDIVAHLIDTGHTPATEADVRKSFALLFDRDATAFEELLAFDYVDSFGLLAR